MRRHLAPTQKDETFGSRLATAREVQGLTQTRLAELLGVSVQRYHAWERDNSTPNSIGLYWRLCDQLDVTVNWLFFGEFKFGTQHCPAPSGLRSVAWSMLCLPMPPRPRVMIDPADAAATAERLFDALNVADPIFHTLNLVAVLLAYDQWMIEFSGVPARATEITLNPGPEGWRENAQAIADILGTHRAAQAVGHILCDLLRTSERGPMARTKRQSPCILRRRPGRVLPSTDGPPSPA